MSGYTVRLIGGPRDGEVIETRMPPFAGSEYTITEGRYVVLGDAERVGAHGALEAAAYYAPNSPTKALGPERRDQFGQAALGVVAGIMWASVALSALGVAWLLGWAAGKLFELINPFTITLLLLGTGALLGAIMGWVEETFDSGGNQ